VPYAIAIAAAAAAAVVAWLARPLTVDPRERAQLEGAVRDLDRELAGNIELMSMFDQTKQAVVLENSEFARHSAALDSYPPVSRSVADVYSRIPEAESAMERRGPANSIRDADRLLIEGWEGDARAARRALRQLLEPQRVRGWRAAIARLRGHPARR
jgi:hypothetical protein